jgi:hypothetical protein
LYILPESFVNFARLKLYNVLSLVKKKTERTVVRLLSSTNHSHGLRPTWPLILRKWVLVTMCFFLLQQIYIQFINCFKQITTYLPTSKNHHDYRRYFNHRFCVLKSFEINTHILYVFQYFLFSLIISRLNIWTISM